MQRKLNEISDKEKLNFTLKDLDITLSKQFIAFKKELKKQDKLDLMKAQGIILSELNGLKFKIEKFLRTIQKSTDTELNSLIDSYEDLKIDLHYAIGKTSRNKFGWIYID